MNADNDLTALHEVGHALVAHALGYRVALVSRVAHPTHPSRGYVRLTDADEAALTDADNALIAAGGVALLQLAGLDTLTAYSGASDDISMVDDLDHDWDERLDTARRILRGRWEPAAERLVAAMKDRPQLVETEFAELVRCCEVAA